MLSWCLACWDDVCCFLSAERGSPTDNDEKTESLLYWRPPNSPPFVRCRLFPLGHIKG